VADVAAGEQRPFAAASTISCSCIRIVTHQQLFKEPALIESAAHFCDALQRHPLADRSNRDRGIRQFFANYVLTPWRMEN